MAFLGPESEKGLAAALAAGRQDKLWHVVDLLYANQGPENGGWINDGLLGSIATHAHLNGAQFDLDMYSAAVARAIETSNARAEADGVTGTPAFFAGPTGGQLQPLQISPLDANAMHPALDQLLAS